MKYKNDVRVKPGKPEYNENLSLDDYDSLLFTHFPYFLVLSPFAYLLTDTVYNYMNRL